MYIGVDYYPEHWPRERWERDAELMEQAGFNVVRLAEFNWVNMEPSEGQFEFGELDEVTALLAEYDIDVILCTPTAVMPAWVARKYPEALAMDARGDRIAWGVRKNNCFTSGAYRLLSEGITRAMAEHFAETANVIGWQTDNEFSGPACYCNSCLASFQDWLRSKYGTIEALNEAWGTHFWGHRVQTWGEIHLPPDDESHNPSACLDRRRHHSWLNVSFQRDQVRIIREIAPDHFITHNFMGLHENLNYYDLAEDLDFVSWDNYPIWGKAGVRYGASLAADVMRGLKKRNFWIMEQTAGPGGWGTFGRNPRPGEIRNVAYQQLGHGCDGQVWFRWRTCTAGREQYWHGLLGHDGRPLRRYEEAKATAAEYRRLEGALEGTTVAAQAAIVYDYESIWALRIQPGYPHCSFVQAVQRYYDALLRAGVNVDIVRPGDDLSQYGLVLAPHLHILPDDIADDLNEYVNSGGILLTDCRTGVKDESNLCYKRTLPGRLRASLGIEIPEYSALADDMQYKVTGSQDFAGSFTAVHYVDWIEAKDAQVLAGYDQWHLEDRAAVTRNSAGEGIGWYVGTVVREAAFYDLLVSKLLEDADIAPEIRPPEGVEVTVREGDGCMLAFLINHTEQSQEVPVPAGGEELVGGGEVDDTVELEGLGVAVIQY